MTTKLPTKLSSASAIGAAIFLLLAIIGQRSECGVEAAAIFCGSDSSNIDSTVKNAHNIPDDSISSSSTQTTIKQNSGGAASEVNQFLQSVQCTLEKAKPWIAELEKEARRLEETAKRVGVRIFSRFNDLVDTLFGHRPSTQNSKPENAVTIELDKDVVNAAHADVVQKINNTAPPATTVDIQVDVADNEIISTSSDD